ncbi:MAG: hypothetical protein QQW96_20280 [Tychonema bourrellyi B0820]|uniref:hypothetical protein n=1 Tax=Tychonema bourrellyi TaxID=54313 RepID=UPI001FEB827D|nr:hypothetical protein [Tychonema bourrellyi]MDQ2099975.1 hypothetical protein [Tychonema bourrellyi B0820]
MTAKTLAPPEQIVHLSGITWQTYENLLAEIGDRNCSSSAIGIYLGHTPYSINKIC